MADHRALTVWALVAALVAGECAALGASQQALPQPVMHRKQPAPPRWASEYQVVLCRRPAECAPPVCHLIAAFSQV